MVGGDGHRHPLVGQDPRGLEIGVLHLHLVARGDGGPDDGGEARLLDLPGDQVPFGAVVQGEAEVELVGTLMDTGKLNPIVGNLYLAGDRFSNNLGGSFVYMGDLVGTSVDNAVNGTDYAVREHSLGTRMLDKKNMDEVELLGNIENEAAKQLVQVALPMADDLIITLATAGMPGVGAGTMALMSASNSAYSAGKRGASGSEQLAAFGTDLVVDYALNKVAFNNLKGLRSTGSEGLERFAKNMAKQGLLSGSEGFVSEVARIASDVAVMGDRSELALYCADYMAKHPEAEERERVFEGVRFVLGNAVRAGAMSAGSGMAAAGVQQIGANYRQGRRLFGSGTEGAPYGSDKVLSDADGRPVPDFPERLFLDDSRQREFKTSVFFNENRDPIQQTYPSEMITPDMPFGTNDSGTEFDRSRIRSQKLDIENLKQYTEFKENMWTHVLMGEVKGNKGQGFHYEGIKDAPGQVIESERSAPDRYGVYQARVMVDGNLKKTPSSFFPVAWSPQQVLDTIHQAYQMKGYVRRNIYEAKMSNGMVIRMYLDADGKIITAFPVWEDEK